MGGRKKYINIFGSFTEPFQFSVLPLEFCRKQQFDPKKLGMMVPLSGEKKIHATKNCFNTIPQCDRQTDKTEFPYRYRASEC